MTDHQKKFGKQGESIACNWLKKQGYRVLAQNFRTPMGEIDIVARDQDTIAFIEVKTRRSPRYGNPKWAITARKRRNISMAALTYLKQIRRPRARARFDVVTISFVTSPPEIKIVKNAFDLTYS